MIEEAAPCGDGAAVVANVDKGGASSAASAGGLASRAGRMAAVVELAAASRAVCAGSVAGAEARVTDPAAG